MIIEKDTRLLAGKVGKMSKNKHASHGPARQLTVDEFKAKHQREFAEDDRLSLPPPPLSLSQMESPGLHLDPEVYAYFKAMTSTPDSRLISQLAEWWLVRLLRAAVKEDCPEGYRELLEDWLIRLGVEPLEGVFIPHRKSPGAPTKKSTVEIYRTWIGLGRPTWSELAYNIYRREYTVADAGRRKKYRDLCRRAVRRQGTRGDEIAT
jgi:hypothetical protein